MTEPHDHRLAEAVARAVEAFEAAVALDPAAGLSAFIPSPDHPHRVEVIAELVRVDMELGWRRGNPARLAEYLLRFPVLASDPKTLGSVAFEEYRQRRLSGEAVQPGEYGDAHAIDVSLWPPITPRMRGVRPSGVTHTETAPGG